MSQPTYIIATSGPSGAGKSTLNQNLTNLFENALLLGIDDYPSDHYPPAVQWLERGANPDEFVTTQLFADVRSLKSGTPILHPKSREEIQPPAFLVLEEPFGRARTELAGLIDFHVDIDIPLETALARRILRIIGDPASNEIPNETNAFVKSHLEWYLRAGRSFYIAVREKASQDTDLAVNGLLPSETNAQAIFEAVQVRRNRQPL